MSLFDQINDDIKKAMLAREKDKLESLRAVKASLLLLKTQDGAGGEISEDAELKLLQKLVKQRKESAEIYRTQQRPDLAEVELMQASFIEVYLPKQMDTNELRGIIAQIITDTGASSVKEMGKVMGVATKTLAGKADNKTISELIRELLPA
jgi:uncharacterized protein YqeY